MSDWNPQIVKIEKVEYHPDADNLDIATVLGDYPVVVKRDEYKVGDLASYISIDSIVPDIEQFYFLCPKSYEKYGQDGEIKQRQIGPKFVLGFVPEKFRVIKAKKIRNVYSQGILVPIYNFYDLNASIEKEGPIPQVGDSVIQMIGLKKWEEEEEDNLPIAKSKGANAVPSPKGWSMPYYDIQSIRKYLKCVEGEQDIILTEKIHGCWFGACHDGQTLTVKSRNFYKKKDEEDLWWEIALRFDLEAKLAKYPGLAFFAELTGNVRHFRYGTEILDGKLHTKLYFFDIYDTKLCRYIDYDNFKDILNELKLESTPLIYRGPWANKTEMYALGERKSVLGSHIAEGWVLSLGKERYEDKLGGRLKLKYIAEQYNLQK